MAETKNSSVVGNEVQTDAGPPPVIDVKPGWQTSEAHLTGIFGLVAVALAAIGYSTTPEKLENGYAMVMGIVKTLGPLGAFVPVLHNYITSRGKAKSNAIMATAQVQSAEHLGNATMQAGLLGSFAGLGGGISIDGLLSAIGGGSGKKDPSTYLGLAKLLGGLLPGGAVVDKVLDKVVPTSGGLTGTATGSGGSGAGSSSPAPSPSDIEAALTQIVSAVRKSQEVIIAWWNSEYPQQHATSLDEIEKFIAANEADAASPSGDENAG